MKPNQERKASNIKASGKARLWLIASLLACLALSVWNCDKGPSTQEPTADAGSSERSREPIPETPSESTPESTQGMLSFQWAAQAGNTSSQNAHNSVERIALDPQGNIYITGDFEGSGVDFGGTTLSTGFDDDEISLLYVAKMDSKGKWLWAKQATPSSKKGGCLPRDLAVDAQGNVYIIGDGAGVGLGNITLDFEKGRRFVAKMDSKGKWLWAKQSAAVFNGITLDSQGNVYTTGTFRGSVDLGKTTLTSKGDNWSMFVAKMSSDGSWVWAKQADSTDFLRGVRIQAAQGALYIAGEFRGSADFGVATLKSMGAASQDHNPSFVAKMDDKGSWIWAHSIGVAAVSEVVVDQKGNASIIGTFEGSMALGSTTLTAKSLQDLFVAKMDSKGKWLWATQTASKAKEKGEGFYGSSLALDAQGSVYMAGWIGEGGDADFGGMLLNRQKGQSFVAKLDGKGSPVWLQQIDAPVEELALDAQGNMLLAGRWYGRNQKFGGVSLASPKGAQDIFVFKAKIGR